MEKSIISANPQQPDITSVVAPNATKPVWSNQQMTCDQCQYNDQDVDTFPCAKCHTRD